MRGISRACRRGGRLVRKWHFSDVLQQSSDVRLWGLNSPKLAAPEGRLLTRFRHGRANLCCDVHFADGSRFKIHLYVVCLLKVALAETFP